MVYSSSHTHHTGQAPMVWLTCYRSTWMEPFFAFHSHRPRRSQPRQTRCSRGHERACLDYLYYGHFGVCFQSSSKDTIWLRQICQQGDNPVLSSTGLPMTASPLNILANLQICSCTELPSLSLREYSLLRSCSLFAQVFFETDQTVINFLQTTTGSSGSPSRYSNEGSMHRQYNECQSIISTSSKFCNILHLLIGWSMFYARNYWPQSFSHQYHAALLFPSGIVRTLQKSNGKWLGGLCHFRLPHNGKRLHVLATKNCL